MLKVKKRTLLLIAGIVWFLAGFNIARIGVLSYKDYISVLNGALSIFVFAMFGAMFFNIRKKHVERIKNYTDEYKSFFCFFDLKSYLLMAFMMTLGIVIRYGGLAPLKFVAVFYTGLGAALALVGILFAAEFVRAKNTEETKMKMSRMFWIILGSVCLALGSAGIVLPVLPTVPFYLVTAFCYAKSSARLHKKFLQSKLYKKHLEGYVKAGGLTVRAKIGIVLVVTIQIGIAFLLLKPLVIRAVLIILWIIHVICMAFAVKTIKNKAQDI